MFVEHVRSQMQSTQSKLKNHQKGNGPRVDQEANVRAIPHDAGLSEKELEAVTLAARGLTSQQVATQMGVKAPTVRSFLQRAYKKLRVSGIEELRAVYGSQGGDAPPLETTRLTNAQRVLYLRGRGLRESDAKIAAAIGSGLSNTQISRVLNYSHGTINEERHRAYRTLGIHSRRELIRLLEKDSPKQGLRMRILQPTLLRPHMYGD